MPPSHSSFVLGQNKKICRFHCLGDAFASIGRPLKLAATNESKAGQACPPAVTFSVSQPNLSPAGPTKFHWLISSFSARYRPDATNGDTLHRSYFLFVVTSSSNQGQNNQSATNAPRYAFHFSFHANFYYFHSFFSR